MINTLQKNIFGRTLSVLIVTGLILSFVPVPAYAIIYQPGATLNPACLPTDTNCGVSAPVTTTGTTSNVALSPTASTSGGTAELRLLELTASGTKYTGFKSPDTLSANVLYTLPSAAGSNGQVLSTDSSGILSWVTVSGGGGALTGFRETGGTFVNKSSISFEAGSFNLNTSGTDAVLRLDWGLAGSASRSQSNTWTGLNVFSSGASVSTSFEVGGTASISALTLGNVLNQQYIDTAIARTSQLSLTASRDGWEAFRDTPSSKITAGIGLSWSVNTLNAQVQTSDLHNPVTLGASNQNYFTLAAGQVLTANKVSLTNHVAGTLEIASTSLAVTATGLTYSAPNISLTSGFNIPLTASTSNWETFMDTPSARITNGSFLNWSGNTLNVSGLLPLSGGTLTGHLVGTGATLSSNFEVGGTASISGTTTLKGVTYTWPAAQGGANTVLSNNGSGGLSWATDSGATSLATPTGSNANGGSISSNVLTLSLADGTNPGLVSTGTQTFAGAKTFSSAPTFSTINSGSVLFVDTGGLVLQDNANLFWDNTNKRLGIGDITPDAKLDVAGSGIFDNELIVTDALQVGGASSLSYSRFGSSATTHALAAANDLLINGMLEVDSAAYFDFSASISSNLEVGGYASISSFKLPLTTGGTLGDCDAAGDTLNWDLTTGKFVCGTDTGGSVASNSLDFDELVNSMTLDADTSITGGLFALTFDHASVSGALETGSLFGAGLTDCDVAGTSKLLWDASTGLFSCGTDSGASTAGWIDDGTVVRLTTATDNVGIGTTSPTVKLDIAQNEALKIGDGFLSSGGDFLNISTNNWYNGTAWSSNFENRQGSTLQLTAGDAVFFSSTAGTGVPIFTTRMIIKGNGPLTGNVGIGTTVPTAKLAISGTASISGATTLAGVTYTWPSIHGSSGYFLQNNGSGTMTWAAASGGSVSSNSINFDELVNSMTLDANLTVASSAYTVNWKPYFASSLIPATDNAYDLGTSALRWRDLYLAFGSLHIGTSGDEAIIDYNVNDDYLAFKPNGSDVRMAILDGGNVGIGTSNPTEGFQTNNKTQTARFGSGYGTGSNSNVVYWGLQDDSNNNEVTKGFVWRIDKPAAISSHADLTLRLVQGFSNSCSGYPFCDLSSINSVGTDAITFTGSGSVGIGTSNPGAKLEVNIGGGTGASLKLEHSGSNFIVRPASSGGPNTVAENTGGGALLINPDGNNVGIGESSPGARLHTNGGSGLAFKANNISGTNDVFTAEIINTCDNCDPADLLALRIPDTVTWENNRFIAFYDEEGQVGQISGDDGASVWYQTNSDRRLKEDIIDAPPALNTLNDLKIRSFVWKGDGSRVEYGFIAQEIHEILPGLVHVGSDELDERGKLKDPWQIDFGRFTPIIIKAVQDLAGEVETLKAELVSLNDKFKEILIAWFADAANGIGTIVANVFKANTVETNELCIKDATGAKTCITKVQLDALLPNTGQASRPEPEVAVEPPPASESTSDSASEIETSPEAEQEPVSDPEPVPVSEPAPQPSPEATAGTAAE